MKKKKALVNGNIKDTDYRFDVFTTKVEGVDMLVFNVNGRDSDVLVGMKISNPFDNPTLAITHKETGDTSYYRINPEYVCTKKF